MADLFLARARTPVGVRPRCRDQAAAPQVLPRSRVRRHVFVRRRASRSCSSTPTSFAPKRWEPGTARSTSRWSALVADLGRSWPRCGTGADAHPRGGADHPCGVTAALEHPPRAAIPTAGRSASSIATCRRHVFICEDGQVKLLDFGVASYAERLASRTPKGVIKGKFPYMSPEQCLSDDLDARTDLFSLGVMLYELTCGRRPFRGLRAVDIVQKVIEAPCDPPSRTRRGYPPELERLLLRVLSKRRGSPRHRPTSWGATWRTWRGGRPGAGARAVAHFAASVRRREAGQGRRPARGAAALAPAPAGRPGGALSPSMPRCTPHRLVVDDEEAVPGSQKLLGGPGSRLTLRGARRAGTPDRRVLLDLIARSQLYDVLDQIRHSATTGPSCAPHSGRVVAVESSGGRVASWSRAARQREPAAHPRALSRRRPSPRPLIRSGKARASSGPARYALPGGRRSIIGSAPCSARPANREERPPRPAPSCGG